ncbi:MAG: methionine--tRNA ligase [Flavobacteriales bacterium]|nr:methionine--tRNA ligase [Flavobacteriales bacterium]
MNKSNESRRFTVTAALPYANGPLHIGHIAGCYLPADIYVRYLRRTGADVLFICGSDEHGVPITLRAEQEGTSPREVVDRYHGILKEAFSALNISFDYYHRTSSELHHHTARDFFLQLIEKGELTVHTTEEFYDESVGRFLADRYIVGTCPTCGYENAYGDQCEKCGRSLSPAELIHPRSRLSGSIPVRRPTRHWYMDLGRHQDTWLKSWILSKTEFWKSNVLGQCLSWMGEGDNHLRPRAVTRDLDWGVPVPAHLEGSQGKVLYVWFEAPIGYISATKAFFEEVRLGHIAKPPWVSGSRWEDYWKMEGQSKLVHFIGKDNIVFHCLIFPAMLKAAGDYILPWQVPANEFLNLEGQKISTSRNYAVWVHEYLSEMPGRVDELRYVLAAGMPEQRDNNFVWKYDGTDNTTDSYQARVNKELVANLGNFINRVVMLTHKFFDAKIPDPGPNQFPERQLEVKATVHAIGEALEQFRFRDALGSLMKLSAWGNRFLQIHEPWKIIHTQNERAAAVLYEAAQLAVALGMLCEPFMPNTSEKICRMLGVQKRDWRWDTITQHELVPPGIQIPAPAILFRKVEDHEIIPQIQKLQAMQNPDIMDKKPSSSPSPTSSGHHFISIEEFKKLRLIVARILKAERIPKADKLLKLTLDIGDDQRTVLSGIAEHYGPEEVEGRLVVLVENLAPRIMRGFESQGMILMADGPEGRPVFIEPTGPTKPGSPVS